MSPISRGLRKAYCKKLSKSTISMNTQILKKFGEKIRRIRRERGISQEKLAHEAGIERSYMGAIERGERNPTLLKIYKIVTTLKVNSSELLPF